MMGDIIGDGCASDVLMGSATGHNAVDNRRWTEAALKPAPGDPLRIQKVADVRATQCNGRTFRAGIEERASVANEGTVRNQTRDRGRSNTVSLTGDQIDRPGAEGPKVELKELSLIAKCCA